ncbi:MAG: FAD-dependent oxidoreductase [Burkholderiaceae bacterium]|nr:FAD-dependent oxidoreductase [Burkholderiaceae bacterium]
MSGAAPALAAGRPRAGRRIAVIGAGWAGLAAAVQAVREGAQVTLIEMARSPGGRARQVVTPQGERFDNGQHVMIGAYTATLALMRRVGADPDVLLLRQPLALCQSDGRGLRLPAGAPVPAFVRGVLAARGWTLAERLALLRTAGGWALRGFRTDPQRSVAALCAGLPAAVGRELIEPLCVAALNTPMAEGSAEVFLRVLHDALLAGRGSADLLLPRVSLSALLPEPAWRWLQAAGADCRAGLRAQTLQRAGEQWQADGEVFDRVILACSAAEAARLAAPIAPGWAALAAALRHEPIVTAYLADARLKLPQPMVALPAGAAAPAQFAFDLGRLHGDAASRGGFAFVASGASALLADGVEASGQALLRQARAVFPGAFAGPDAQVLRHVAAERRATFACTPAMRRPPMQVAPGLLAAGDYIAGPYPATLEGAVRCGIAAATGSS